MVPQKPSIHQTGNTEISGYSRRSVLCATSTALFAAVAGCTARASQQPAKQTLVRETVRVSPGQYETVKFSLNDEQWVMVSAYLSDRSVDRKNDGPGVDAVVMTPQQLTQFETDGTFSYMQGVSMPDVTVGKVADTLPSGEYVVVVDNSTTGSGEPGEDGVTAVVQLEITATSSRPKKGYGATP